MVVLMWSPKIHGSEAATVDTRAPNRRRQRCAMSYLWQRSCRSNPFAHRLIAGAIDVHCVIDLGHPSEGDEVVLPLVVSGKLDAVRTLHVIDDRKLSAVRANDGRVRLDFAGLDHIDPESTIHAAFVAPSCR
jgi:hypothetical protein